VGDEVPLVRREIEPDAVHEDERDPDQSVDREGRSPRPLEGRSTRSGTTRSGMIARARAIIGHAVCRSNRSSAS